MDSIRLRLEPTSVPEWDAEDALAGVLGGEQPARAEQAQLQEELDKAVIELPRSLNPRPLTRHEPREELPQAAPAGPDTARHDFPEVWGPVAVGGCGDGACERGTLPCRGGGGSFGPEPSACPRPSVLEESGACPRGSWRGGSEVSWAC